MSFGGPNDPATEKRKLRSAARRAAAGLDPRERVRRSRAIQDRLVALHEFRTARACALYSPLPDEVLLDVVLGLLRARGARLAYPRIEGSGISLCWIASEAALVSGALPGVLEPRSDAPLAPLSEVDLVLVPGLLFDRSGRRLGRGGGHYDRLLARIPSRTPTFGLCWAGSLVDRLPAEPHDVALSCVVTDEELLRIP